ncbi:MAG: glycosyltransferase family 1 protein [Bacteroidota bacterium]
MKEIERPLRVAYFAGTMKPGHDGVTRVLYRLAESLTHRDVESMFFSPLIPPREMQPVPMVRVPSVVFPLHREYRLALPNYASFAHQLQSFKPDLMHINSPCTLGHAAVRYATVHGIPVVATYHTHFPSYARYYKVKPLEGMGWNYLRGLYNEGQRLYVPSEPILGELLEHGFHNLYYLPHGVDLNAFQPQFRSAAWKEGIGASGKNVVLFVGRLVWEKDLRVLADAYRLVQEQREDLVFAIVGDGPVRSELEQMMPEARFLGYQAGEALATSYASSDLFVMPSTTETFGNVTLEAMASGIAPVCANAGGARGIIRPGITGLLAEPGDPRDLAEKLLSLIDNPGKRAELADQALRFARQQTWERIFDELFEDYHRVIRSYERANVTRRRKAA